MVALLFSILVYSAHMIKFFFNLFFNAFKLMIIHFEFYTKQLVVHSI